MLSAVAAAGQAAGDAAAARTRTRLAAALQEALPEVAVTVEDETVVLAGRISPDDARLRWIGSMLR